MNIKGITTIELKDTDGQVTDTIVSENNITNYVKDIFQKNNLTNTSILMNCIYDKDLQWGIILKQLFGGLLLFDRSLDGLASIDNYYMPGGAKTVGYGLGESSVTTELDSNCVPLLEPTDWNALDISQLDEINIKWNFAASQCNTDIGALALCPPHLAATCMGLDVRKKCHTLYGGHPYGQHNSGTVTAKEVLPYRNYWYVSSYAEPLSNWYHVVKEQGEEFYSSNHYHVTKNKIFGILYPNNNGALSFTNSSYKDHSFYHLLQKNDTGYYDISIFSVFNHNHYADLRYPMNKSLSFANSQRTTTTLTLSDDYTNYIDGLQYTPSVMTTVEPKTQDMILLITGGHSRDYYSAYGEQFYMIRIIWDDENESVKLQEKIYTNKLEKNSQQLLIGRSSMSDCIRSRTQRIDSACVATEKYITFFAMLEPYDEPGGLLTKNIIYDAANIGLYLSAWDYTDINTELSFTTNVKEYTYKDGSSALRFRKYKDSTSIYNTHLSSFGLRNQILCKGNDFFSAPITHHDYIEDCQLYIICPNTEEENIAQTASPFSCDSDRLCFDARLGIVSFGVVGGYKSWYEEANEFLGVDGCYSPLQKVMSHGAPPLFLECGLIGAERPFAGNPFCLSTINNLDRVIKKTDTQTMSITYTLKFQDE